GSLGILTAPNQTVDVNGALSAPSGVQIDAGTINVAQPISSTNGSVSLTARAPATLNIGAPVTARTGVALISDVTNIGAPVTVTQNGGFVVFKTVTTGRPVSLGVEAAGALSLTQQEFDLLSASGVGIGGGFLGD